MSKLDRIYYFIKTVESNSFSSAARAVGISTAAISKQIAKLEEEIQIQLLNRTTRKIELTESGRLYYDRCKQLLEQIEETEKLASHLSREPSGRLKVVCSYYFGEKYVLPRLKAFLSRFPKIKLDLELAERMPDLNKEKVDILFGVSLPGAEDWVQKQITKTRYVICATPEYLKSRGEPKRPIDLLQHAYITHSMRKPDDQVEFKNQQVIHLIPSLRLNDTRAMLQCALEGLGIVKLHLYAVADALAQDQLKEVLRDYQVSELPVYLYYQSAQYVQPKIREFVTFFGERQSF